MRACLQFFSFNILLLVWCPPSRDSKKGRGHKKRAHRPSLLLALRINSIATSTMIYMPLSTFLPMLRHTTSQCYCGYSCPLHPHFFLSFTRNMYVLYSFLLQNAGARCPLALKKNPNRPKNGHTNSGDIVNLFTFFREQKHRKVRVSPDTKEESQDNRNGGTYAK